MSDEKRFDHTKSFVIPKPVDRLGSYTTLESWNTYRREYWEAAADRFQHPEKYINGLVCQKCGGYLYDTLQQTKSSPTMLRVKCQLCDFKGDRYE